VSTKRIGVDIDGVMYQWSKTARYMLREILPDSPYTKDGPMGTESTSWDYIMENISKDHWRWLWSEGVRLGLFRHGHLYAGTIKAIRQLSEVGKVVLITSRPDTAIEDTAAWVAFNRFSVSGLHILGNGIGKSTVQPRCDVYIDDKPENCEELVMNTGATVAMPDRPWNQGPTPDGVVRVFSWDQFVELARTAPRVA
jgi:uncharacterized HAD superfamily protein